MGNESKTIKKRTLNASGTYLTVCLEYIEIPLPLRVRSANARTREINRTNDSLVVGHSALLHRLEPYGHGAHL